MMILTKKQAEDFNKLVELLPSILNQIDTKKCNTSITCNCDVDIDKLAKKVHSLVYDKITKNIALKGL